MSVRSGAVEQTGRGGGRPRQRGPPTPVMAQYQVRYSTRGYDFEAVRFSPRPTPASLMDAEQPEHSGFSDASNQM